MKKVALLIILMMVPLWAGFYYIADRGIKFDPVTEQYLKEELQTIKLSKNLVKSVEYLDLSNHDLTSISGLEYFTNLKELNLSGNLLTDASPLKELTDLVVLDLSFNQLDALELKSERLEILNLEGNRFVTIDFAESLESLFELNLRANHVSDLSPLEGLHQLRALNIRGNQVKTLDVLKSKTTLMDLNARNNQISSVEPLVGLPLSERLYLTGNAISDLDLLEDKLKDISDFDFEIGIPSPEFRVPSGVYAEPFDLEIRTASRHQIYYTLDGSKPTLQAHKYTGPIEISEKVMLEQTLFSNIETTPLREAFAFEAEDVKKAITVTAASYINGDFGESVTFTYILDSELFDANLPVVSLTIDPRDLFDEHEGIYVPGVMYETNYHRTGNYYQKGREFEKEGIMEFFNEEGALSFRQNIGVRIHGSYTRVLPQKSLRIYPRSDYGQSRIYSKIFEDLPYHEFNLLVLRNSGNDNNSTLMRDGLMHELIKDRGLDVQAYRPSIVLLNGEYWGIHNIRERFSEDYIDTKYNVKEEDLSMISVYTDSGVHFESDVGTLKDQNHYYDLLKYVEENDMTKDASIEYADTQMDIDNFLEYVAYQVYYANTDSFFNNMTLWRKKVDFTPNAPVGHDGRWRWMVYDLDRGMGHGLLGSKADPISYNMMNFVLSDEKSMKLFRGLMDNESLQYKFGEIMLTLLSSNFEPASVHEKIDELAAVIRPEIGQSITRWENIESVEEWEANIELLHEFAERRPDIVKQQMIEKFGWTQEQLIEIEKKIATEKK